MTGWATFEGGERVRVVGTELAGQVGAVVKDERDQPGGGIVARGVWVLLDAGANPQSFPAAELRPA